MKKLLLVLIAGFVLVMSQGLRQVAAGGDDDASIPLKTLAGKYADTSHGSYALCLDATKPAFPEIKCTLTTPKTDVFPQTEVDVGYETDDKRGNSCETFTASISDEPPDTSPPFVQVYHSVGKVTSYDPATGSGDGTFTSYIGGNCVGAGFSSSGATINSTGAFHFVTTGKGRTDFNFTALTDPISGIVDFSYVGTSLKQ
jgi:hypothetical protein